MLRIGKIVEARGVDSGYQQVMKVKTGQVGPNSGGGWVRSAPAATLWSHLRTAP